MHIIIGLGNPGSVYQYHRHNFGFMAVDMIQEYYGLPPFRKKGCNLLTEGKIGDHSVVLLKPQTYMNHSGQGVADIVQFYKIPLGEVIVFHDDLDVKMGSVRFKIGGGHGGHNGLRSIDECVGKEYVRVRLGIGHPGHASLVSSYVLNNFTPLEADILSVRLEVLTKNVQDILSQNFKTLAEKIAVLPLPQEAP